MFTQSAVAENNIAKQAPAITVKEELLIFGPLRPYKGAKYLIEAFEHLPSDLLADTALIVAGEAWEDTEAIELAKSSPAHDKIHLFSEYISDDDIPKLFSAADTLVLPYTRASQSGVAHIGISYGMPAICSEVGGLVESMSKYDGTLLLPPMDVESLANALTTVLTNPGKKYEIPVDLRWETIAES